MNQFLTSASTVRLIEQIVIESEDDLVLVTPSPTFTDAHRSLLKGAADRGVSISLLVDDVLFNEEVAAALEAEVRISIVRCRNLNGNCYANERHLMITSYGLAEIEPSGHHFGVVITSEDAAFEAARTEICSICDGVDGAINVNSVLDRLTRQASPGNGNAEPVEPGRSDRLPVMRVIRGGQEGAQENGKEGEPGANGRHRCAACGKAFDLDKGVGGLCRECESRKTYRHNAVFISPD